MAENNAQNKLEQPKNTKKEAPKIEARMFAMPEQYRHGAEGNMHKPQESQPADTPHVEVKTPAVPTPPKAPPKPAVPPKKKQPMSSTKKLLMAGAVFILLLLVGGGVAWYFTQAEQEVAPEVPTPEPPTSRPAPEPQEDPEEEEPDEEPEEKPEDPFGGEVLPGVDTDSDGLTDKEEELVYGTDPRLPDTDADGFLDGNEVFHRYNPAGTAPGTLVASGLVVAYEDQAGRAQYEMTYPSKWSVEVEDEAIIFEAETGEAFILTSTDKQPRTTLEEWVEAQEGMDGMTKGVSKNGLATITSEDQLTTYIDLGYAVLTLTYDTGIKSRVDYLQTYQMMINSFKITEVLEEPEEEISEEVSGNDGQSEGDEGQDVPSSEPQENQGEV